MARRNFGSLRKLPSGRWQARYRHPITGEQHTAPDTFATKTDADRYLAGVQVDLDRGTWRDPKLGRVTFAAWADAYMEGAVHKRATTRATNESNIKHHILPFFGPIPVALIRPLDVRRFVEGMVANGYKPSTVRTVYAALRAILNAAVQQEIIASSPCRGIKLPPKTRGEMRILTAEQVVALAEAIDKAYRAMVYLAGVMGLRWSEIAGLRVGRLDLLSRTLTVAETAAQVGGFSDVKTPASRRTLPIPPFLVEILAEHLAERGLTRADADELVFVSSTGGRLQASNWHKRSWQPALKKAGLEGFHFHWLRHSSVALMVELGTHPKVIQERLGHASWATTMDTYGHILSTTDDGVTDRLDAMFRTASGSRKGSTPEQGASAQIVRLAD